MNTIKKYMLDNYTNDELKDIVAHGCISGCAGTLIYYKDTVSFYENYENEIWGMLNNDMEEQGYNSVFELLVNFNHTWQVKCGDTFKNFLAWYAAEKVAKEIIDNQDEECEE